MPTDLTKIRADAAATYNSISNLHTHNADQTAAATKLIELFLLAFKYYDFDEVRKLSAKDYKKHDQTVEGGPESITDFAKRVRAEEIKDGCGLDEPGELGMEYKRIFVDGEYVIPHMHITTRSGQPDLQAIEPMLYKDGLSHEHWTCLQPMPD
ncbi:hypothetical protein EKO04_000967 [Ascochyta lentis]|uniref:SnoaL-like domain-containing protein n=1 Tax=Ascochyta lentis TaxID=205686 RepID=A0A8H7MMN4_9PLEO|nr:hypothetical protein EKO04_000967 [Ascochyta lentis]